MAEPLPEARTVEEVQRALSEGAAEPAAGQRLNIVHLLRLALERTASDLHLAVAAPPLLRINGVLIRSDLPPLARDESKRLIYSLLTDSQKAQFERDLELDLSIAIKDLGRFRVNVHYQRGSVEAALRVVPLHIRTLEELGLPAVVAQLTRRPSGLLLITGPTGQGKTTTLAAMVELINTERDALIIVIEDPIEYVFKHKRSIVKQREVSADTHSVAEAMRRALRQDPDVIVVGDLREVETIATALAAAETGHLVLATMPTLDALQTVNRLLDVFPSHQQQQVQIQLSDALQGIVSQHLLPRADGNGRVLAVEVLSATPVVREQIRHHTTAQLPTLMQAGEAVGMTTMDASLKRLARAGLITYETAISRATSPHEFSDLKQ